MIDAMKMALEALENHSGNYKLSKTECVLHNVSVSTLRQAIEQAEKQTHTDHPMRHWDRTCPACVAEAEKQEPKAYLCENAVGYKYFRWKKPTSHYKPIALYTAPVNREWVGLTDDEVAKIVDMNTSDDGGFDLFCDGHSIASAVMDKLQELNK